MTTNRFKAGYFSDGGFRLVGVTAGNVADPVPTDPSQVIFNSDWGETLVTDSAHMGTVTLSASTTKTTIYFPSLGFIPFATVAFTPASYDVSTTGYATNEGNYFSFVNEFANGTPPGSVGAQGQNWAYYEVYEDHINLIYNPNMAFVNGGDAFPGAAWPATVKVAWCVFQNNAGLTSVGGARSGTNWMRWTQGGPLIAKPGKNVSSSSVYDFLVNPAGGLNLSIAANGVVSSLPFVSDTLISGADYDQYNAYIVTHGLGYIPLFILNQNLPFGTGSGATVMMTPTQLIFCANFEIATSTSGYGSALPLANPISYTIYNQRWV